MPFKYEDILSHKNRNGKLGLQKSSVFLKIKYLIAEVEFTELLFNYVLRDFF